YNDHSFIRYLQNNKINCFVVDWNHPAEDEKRYTLSDYIARLEKFALTIAAENKKPLHLLGYCMGGTLATALAHQNEELFQSIVLIATPWDFEADGGTQKNMLSPAFPFFEKQIDLFGQLPTESLQLCFAMLDPMMAMDKFSYFANLATDSVQASRFVLLEDWLNDGVPLAGPVARECLLGWYQENQTAKGNWRIHDQIIRPENISLPTLHLIPSEDRIVPPASSEALADIFVKKQIIKPKLGHIGMMSSTKSKDQVWAKINDFIQKA
ncbi:MAG: alpha/beta fold hydrolase, partial [Alphaproteobacteria bacterium]|nr:alpha/beta fold hydrolase [Alphaproteobacteria bacterium]